YPGEPLPRWALTSLWRTDGKPLWKNPVWLAADRVDAKIGPAQAQRFATRLAATLGLHADYVITAYEDVWQITQAEQKLPVNVDPLTSKLHDAPDRKRLSALLGGDLGEAVGFVLPLKAEPQPRAPGATAWRSSAWPLKREHLYLLAGDSPMGLRLPLDSLPWIAPHDVEPVHTPDPFEDGATLHEPDAAVAVKTRKPKPAKIEVGKSAVEIVHTAL